MNSEDIILGQYEIRKSNKEKTRFIDYMKERLTKSGYGESDITIESKGKWIFKSRNIVVGNPKEAEVFVTAHYDTCAVMPFPNLMAPTNPVIFWGYQVLLVILIVLLAALVAFPIGLFTDSATVSYNVFLISLILFIIQLMFGFSNKHTANDNTSGVIAITQLLEELPAEHRKKVCVVYFDNEEKGLFGSAFFAKRHKKDVKGKLLINIDCIGDGRNIVTMADRKARNDKTYELLVNKFEDCERSYDIKYLCRKMKFMLFPSDQINFKKVIGICALKKSPIGMCVARIHTPFDTKCREENVEYVSCAIRKFVEEI